MNEDSDFFGGVFDDPDDDPLLGGEESEPDSHNDASEKGPPSWMSEGQENGEASGSTSDQESTSGKESGPPKKEILIERGSSQEGVRQINEAIGEGWKLVRISLGQPDGEQASSQREARQFVATLEQEGPQSLFEFG